VVPGTAKVTLGGAIASDIHGKSHHKVGSFSCHLVEMKILDSKGNISVIQPCGETSDLFWATVGGMGLTGLIVEATINLMKIETAFVSVSEKRVKSLDELIQTLMKFNVEHHYTVAWVDLSGDFRGRGIVSAADHILLKDLPQNLEPTKLKSVRQTERSLPIPFGFCLINNFTIRVFNFLWLHKPLGRAVQQIQKYMHPLDGFSNWNILYGKRGFVQYQFVIPIDKHSVLKLILAKLQAEKCASFLTVLKTLGQPSKGLIGFPMEGWTLAIDLPLGNRNLNRILSELDDLVLRASGRLYLTKDSRMRPEHLDFMYPEIQRWKSIKSEFDSENYWQSDQGRRLKLC
jgi:decaprenylphospho-beta-D-ribofuranose 2-oxidase